MSSYPKTKAHEKHKAQVQAAFDFAVTACYAVPQLENHLTSVESGKTPLEQPTYFALQNTTAYLREGIKNFEPRLSSYLYLSLFSFFESFVHDVVEELISFHGGPDAMIKMAERRDAAIARMASDPGITKSVRKLKKEKKGKEQKYRKYSDELRAKGFRFPTERLSAFGVRMLIEKHESLKAFGLLDFLSHGLALPVTEAQRKTFHGIRVIRNRIAHGRPDALTLDDVRRANDFFREISFKVNTHLLENFFTVEKYAY